MTSGLTLILTGIEWALAGLLLALSVSSLALIFRKASLFRRYLDAKAFDQATQTLSLDSPETLAGKALATLRHQSHADKLTLEYRVFISSERLALEQGLNFLATLGANAPFIGLLGTVLGIIRAFAALSLTDSGSEAVMAGISQALLATAMGLFVAIPAVVAFNYFAARIKRALVQCERLKDAYMLRSALE